MTAEELLERYAAGERDFSGVEINGLKCGTRCKDLNGATLPNVIFKNAKLSRINFMDANLKGADFTNADIGYVGMDRANLENAIFRNAQLGDVIFEQANLRYTNWYESSMRPVGFMQADLEGADFRQAHMIQTVFKRANLRHVDFTGAILGECILTRTDLSEVIGLNPSDSFLDGMYPEG